MTPAPTPPVKEEHAIPKYVIALALLAEPACAPAADCSIDVDGNDAMQFDRKEIVVDAGCKDFTIRLAHSGKLVKDAMGHNLVVARAAGLQAGATDGMTAGAGNDNVKPGDERVIAHTKVIGGGESAAVTFATARSTRAATRRSSVRSPATGPSLRERCGGPSPRRFGGVSGRPGNGRRGTFAHQPVFCSACATPCTVETSALKLASSGCPAARQRCSRSAWIRLIGST